MLKASMMFNGSAFCAFASGWEGVAAILGAMAVICVACRIFSKK